MNRDTFIAIIAGLVIVIAGLVVFGMQTQSSRQTAVPTSVPTASGAPMQPAPPGMQMGNPGMPGAPMQPAPPGMQPASPGMPGVH